MPFFYLCVSVFLSVLSAHALESAHIFAGEPLFIFTGVLSGGIGAVLLWLISRGSHGLKRVKRVQSLTHLSWQEYESLCMSYLREKGVTANLSKGGADGGIDIHAQWKNSKIVVQCKHWKKPVGVSIVREMYGIMCGQEANSVIIFASGGFSKPAWAFAKGKPVYLVGGKKLIAEINKL